MQLIDDLVLSKLDSIELSAHLLNWKYEGHFFKQNSETLENLIIKFCLIFLKDENFNIFSTYVSDDNFCKHLIDNDIGTKPFWRTAAVLDKHNDLKQFALDFLEIPRYMHTPPLSPQIYPSETRKDSLFFSLYLIPFI